MRVIASFLSPNKQTGKIPDLAEQSHNVGEANIEVDITDDTATQIAHQEMDVCQTQVHVLPDAELTPEAVDDYISEPETADDVFVPKPGPSHSKADMSLQTGSLLTQNTPRKTKLRRELLKVKRRVLRLQSASEAIPTKQGFLKQCDIHLSSELAAIVKFNECIIFIKHIFLALANKENLLPEMEWFGKLYNHFYWENQISVLEDEQCRKHMNEYIRGLRNGTSWASKMFDASGHYSSQFFFGNDFWLGSSTLCEELGNNETSTDPLPFQIRFYMARIRININDILTPVTRQLNIGECLPKSCKPDDIRLLMLHEKSQARSLNVIDVRPVPGSYCVFDDGTLLFIYGLIVLATVYYLIINTFGKKEQHAKHVHNNNVEEQKSKPVPKMRGEKLSNILLCFCFTTNAQKILSVDRVPDEAIKCIHGLRFFSIAWIIMVHTYLEVFAVGDNKTMRTVTERSFLYQTVSNATFSVDTFFFISGTLVTMLYFRTAQRKQTNQSTTKTTFKNSFLHYFSLTLYRFLRLTPAYLFVLGVNELVLKYAHNNSVFSPAMIDHITCSAYWWRNALYINNFFPQTEFCMLWSWYIANDTQFYLLAIFILAFAVRNNYFKWAAAAVLIFLVTSWITTFVIAMQYNYVARVEEPFALFDQLYDKPWMRIGPYLVGMATGYILFRFDGKIKLPSYVVVSGWILAVGLVLSLVYGLGKGELVTPVSAIYATFGHTSWGLALAWITVSCCWGYGGPVNSLLGFRGFLPLSRLTYCAYLIHPVIMVFVSFQLDGPIHIHNHIVLVTFLGNLVTSFLLAFVVSIAFEAPVVQLMKLLLVPSSKRKEESCQ
ncbi:Nose resistant-to-fluoxetine protein, N-terminal domain [Popillia japonica]|uniref:Nose resistant-to-fluoxetine protein, N-terminal domain n=1 Tax=Popillia japonica TaxID=7064 RepID=A0AAW1IB93_POPJA